MNPFSPSEYTAALLFHLRRHAAKFNLGHVLEIGTGSGVVIASLLALGARRAVGVDIEAAAVQATQDLLRQQGSLARALVVQGDMWLPCQGERFDLVVSNLPQFPTERIDLEGRLPTWSAGGPDGRSLVDRFLRGLPEGLAPGGLAIMTHNVFIDAAATQEMLEPWGLQARVVYSASAPVPPQKLASLAPEVAQRHAGRGLHRIGRYWFVDFDLVEISWKTDAPPGR